MFVLASLAASITAQAAEQTWLLTAEKNLTTRAEARIQVSGELKLLETAGTEDGGKSRQKTTSVPISVAAQLRYHDRSLPDAATAVIRRAARLYELAAAKMEVGKGVIAGKLGDEHKLIVVQESNDDVDLFSPAGPLDRSEFDLLSVAGDSGLLNHLLPEKKVKQDDQWEPTKEVLTRLLRLEVINQSDVTLTLSKVDKGVAIITIAGKVSGGVDGVTSDLELDGKLNFDLTKKCCTWLALNLKEDRGASQGAPGFSTNSQIRVAIAPAAIPPELSDEAVAELKTTPDEGTRLFKLAARQNFELVYEPRWRVVSDQPDVTVLRLIDRGDLVAQCNISKLSPLGEGEQLTLEAYQENLKKSLGTTFVDLVEGGESLSDSGLRVLRVVASASVSEVPIQYVFYHLSDDHQRRLSLAFTMDAEQVERFGRAEETLISSLQFIEQKEADKVSAREKTSKSGLK